MKVGIEKITVRILQKNKEPEWKAKDLLNRLDSFNKAYRETVKEVKKETRRK